MKTIYIDSDFKCHVANDGTMTPVEEEFFEDKCDAFIEGHRLKPEGETWIREDGVSFSGGKMIAAWKNYSELDDAQREYERHLLAEYEALVDDLYSEVTS